MEMAFLDTFTTLNPVLTSIPSRRNFSSANSVIRLSNLHKKYIYEKLNHLLFLMTDTSSHSFVLVNILPLQDTANWNPILMINDEQEMITLVRIDPHTLQTIHIIPIWSSGILSFFLSFLNKKQDSRQNMNNLTWISIFRPLDLKYVQ